MKKKITLIIKDLVTPLTPSTIPATIEDLLVHLKGKGYWVDGVFIEVKSKRAYAWRNRDG